MKVPSNDLFTLIKSLTAKEKQYFKLSAEQFNSTIYIFLFDSIDKMKIYDESAVKDAMKRKNFNGSFKSIKNYLFETLLKFLNDHHCNLNINVELNGLLVNAEVLYDKGLFNLALKRLDKAKQIAARYDKFEFLIRVSTLKQKIYETVVDVKGMWDHLKNDSIERKIAINKLANYIDYYTLALEINAIHSSGLYNRDKGLRERTKRILEHPLMQSAKKAMTFYATSQYYFIHLAASSLIPTKKSAIYVNQKKWIEFMEKRSKLNFDIGELYLNSVGNFISLLHSSGKTNEIESWVKKVDSFIKLLPGKFLHKGIYNAYMSFISNVLHIYIIRGDVNYALQLCLEKQPYLKYVKSSNVQQGYLSCLVAIYFLRGDLKSALHYANLIINTKGEIRKDLRFYIRYLLLLINYELNNYDVLIYNVKSIERLIKANKLYSEADKINFSYFKNKTIISFSKKDKDELFKKWKQKLKEKNVRSAIFSEENAHFDFELWLESKIQNRPLVELLQEKNLRNGN